MAFSTIVPAISGVSRRLASSCSLYQVGGALAEIDEEFGICNGSHASGQGADLAFPEEKDETVGLSLPYLITSSEL